MRPIEGLRFREGEMGELLEAVGYGFVKLGLAADTAVKSHTPVRGGFRTFNPNQPIGGTLRRSIHFVVYVNGRRISPKGTDDNGNTLPDYVPLTGIVLYVGTNSGYGFWVHEGTTRMAARPFLLEGWSDVRGQAQQLIASGTRQRLGQ
jgi:hypothetical protein